MAEWLFHRKNKAENRKINQIFWFSFHLYLIHNHIFWFHIYEVIASWLAPNYIYNIFLFGIYISTRKNGLENSPWKTLGTDGHLSCVKCEHWWRWRITPPHPNTNIDSDSIFHFKMILIHPMLLLLRLLFISSFIYETNALGDKWTAIFNCIVNMFL